MLFNTVLPVMNFDLPNAIRVLKDHELRLSNFAGTAAQDRLNSYQAGVSDEAGYASQ
ncbi:hypothetical protein [Marmoricola sp. URHB0036]|uniref:hypothetical protein n=1 Tax=Marmoricola sp. URHB0036 TaxID=1298863 RepID=UPI0012DE430F|nr:hypothetical protein [Marmoricola sp. URHB0036]